MSVTVSIIVPVYNIGMYIENCLESLCAQSFSDIEILCIDDGSTDSGAQRIKEFAERDGRIRYIYQQNGGVSAARNKGIDASCGEYIFFVDGDDYIHPQTIELSLDCAQKTGADMVCSHYEITSDMSREFENISGYTYEESDFEALFRKGDMLGKCSVSKLIRKSVTESIRFPEGVSVGEDGCYIIKLMNENIRAVTVDKTFYFYYKREGSATTSKLDERRMTILYAYDGLCDYLKETENVNIRAYCLRSVYYNINTRRTLYRNSEYSDTVEKECRRIGKKHLKSFLSEKEIPLGIRVLHTVFFKVPILYRIYQKVL
ncbi:MAG: glycosyltransferase family 2 protein [Clostridia bacterium]|nr:glycosyltransferase family 2 protein [Clostridia bacterium]